ncbi:hypothetical protein N474_07710 [Pseudoalteromonas luteoviolacea CPMOR-2]|uniref:DUF6151 family protein n=1 Tax=Pseudoalteromonas luteoviolacea TaxID=43657 RepID=UPI0007B06EB9|nr:DUF6151 family protein [Pseudoalteromonas luteoviolacea]KZN57857.1 hypothetical protein N474_07710 [Pseudoalteromonas luteoviolacea CPMOR-2]
MAEFLNFQCDCGAVTGKVASQGAFFRNRVVCYCDDCQAFVNHLGHEKSLNPYGGTDVFQVSASQVSITSGQEHLKCMKITAKGVHRWYASCCNAPIGNTINAKWPLVGFISTCIVEDLEKTVGPIKGSVFCKFANQPIPNEVKGPWSHKRIVATMLLKLVVWRILGKGAPNPFYAAGKAISKPYCIANEAGD